LRTYTKPCNTYAVFASLAVGFTAFVFLHVWTRALPSLFASPVLTGGWVPCSVLVGIVLGCLYFTGKALLVGSPARMFSLMLFAFGVVGIPVWQLLRAAGKAPDALLGAGITSTGALTAILAVITFCILFIPGFLLGGILAFGAIRTGPRRVTAAYPLWPLFIGLAAGPAILTFGMLPHLGGVHCMMIAAAVAAAAGLAGLFRRSGAHEPDSVSGRRPAEEPNNHSTATGAVLETIYVFAVVTWAVLWFRLSILATGPSLQALAALLIACFTGLAAGSAVSASLAGRQAVPKAGMGIVAGATAVLLLYLGRSAGSLPLIFLDAVGDLPLVWGDLLTGYFVFAFLTLFAPALLLGIFLQMASRVAGPDGARSTGSGPARFALATLGALLATRFVPVESIPLRSLIVVLPWITLVVSLVLLLANRSALAGRLAWTSAVVAAGVVLSITQPRWTPVLLSRGIYALPLELKQVDNLPEVLAGGDLLLHQDDPDGIVSVDRTPDAMTLRVDGTVRASAENGMVPHLLAGHIPLLLHADPQNVFLDGLDAGLTLRSVETYPLEEIHCTEPSAAVVRAAGLFSLYNGDALEDARLSLHTGSTRNHLLFTDNRYDVIVLRSPPPYSYSSAERLTTDFFSLARSRLTPGGIVCQQVSTFDLATDSFRSLAKSFAYYFPHVTVWWIGDDEILLLGSSRPFIFPEEAVRNRMALPEVEEGLTRLGMTDPLGILSCFVMRRDNLMDLCGGAELLTADSNRLLLEWPKRTLHLVRTDGLEDLGSVAENPIVLIRGLDSDSSEYKILRDRLDRCRTAREFSVKSLVAMREGKIREAVSLLGESPASCPLNGIFRHGLADYYIVLSRSMLGSRMIEDAIRAARRAVELLPGSPRTYYNLASIELTRDPSTAIALLDRAMTLNPYYVPAYLLKAETELAMGEPKDAAETVGRVLPMEPFNMDAHHVRGLSFIQRRMYPEGRAELALVLEAEPENTAAIDALAYSWLVDDELDKAERLYKRLLEIDPAHLGALNNYATILAEKGRYREAITIWTEALEIRPGDKNIVDNIEDARQSMRR